MKFPIDAPKTRVIKALEILGFKLVREREHLAQSGRTGNRNGPSGKKEKLVAAVLERGGIRHEA